jgi:hypothetical protein
MSTLTRLNAAIASMKEGDWSAGHHPSDHMSSRDGHL